MLLVSRGNKCQVSEVDCYCRNDLGRTLGCGSLQEETQFVCLTHVCFYVSCFSYDFAHNRHTMFNFPSNEWIFGSYLRGLLLKSSDLGDRTKLPSFSPVRSSLFLREGTTLNAT